MRGLLDHLDVPVRELSFPATSRVRAVAADALWYPRLHADGVDVLHCPTFRGPFRSKTPLVVTVHDLAVLRRAAVVQPLDAHLLARRRAARRARRRRA